MANSEAKPGGPLTNLRKLFAGCFATVAILLVVLTAAVAHVLDDVVVCGAFTAIVSICTAVVTALYGEHKATMLASIGTSAEAKHREQLAAIRASGKETLEDLKVIDAIAARKEP